MGIFSKKKKKEEQTVSSTFSLPDPPHIHIWKDMPWYILVNYDDGERSFEYKIIEPFICVSGCGKRIDKVLEQDSFYNASRKWREEFLNNLREKYKDYLKPQAVVEDMINDIFLVKDPQHLQMVEKMRGLPHQGVGNSYSTIPQSDYRIKVEK